MNLVVFDIDGTLTRTNEVDELCFANSVREVFGINEVSTNWADYKESTDSGILEEIFLRLKDRPPTAADVEKFQKHFVQNLEMQAQKNPRSFDPVDGALDIFERIRKSFENTFVAIATGAWKPSALYKLSAANVPTQQVPAAYADDHKAREGIVTQAIERAKKSFATDNWTTITYVGDGTWDLKASQALQINFIGVTDRRDPQVLAKRGAQNLTKDYAAESGFLDLLAGIFSRRPQ